MVDDGWENKVEDFPAVDESFGEWEGFVDNPPLALVEPTILEDGGSNNDSDGIGGLELWGGLGTGTEELGAGVGEYCGVLDHPMVPGLIGELVGEADGDHHDAGVELRLCFGPGSPRTGKAIRSKYKRIASREIGSDSNEVARLKYKTRDASREDHFGS